MINYNIGTIVFLSILTTIYPIYAVAAISPFNIFIIILLVVAFEVIAFFLMVRKKEFWKRSKKKKSDTPEDLHPIVKETIADKIDELNGVLKPFGFAYFPEKDIFYSLMYGWQKDFGYCMLYDEMTAPLCMIIDCEPIRFDYDGKQWLIEVWKGQYGMTTGCELGVYNTTGPDLDIPGFFHGNLYKSVNEEDFLNMSVELRKNGKVLFTRNDLHWWLTGFILGEFSQPDELVVDISITLKDPGMRDAFVEELINVGYTMEDLQITDNTVFFTFDKPHSKQPFTRNPLTEAVMQKYNRQNCEAYQKLTHHLTNTLERIEYVRKESPKMYQQIIHLGKPKQLFGDFEVLKKYLDPVKESDE